LPERILLAETTMEGLGLTAVFSHVPPGVSWGIVRPRQAVAFARRLSAQQGPVPMGADANTPLVDAVDFAETRTHCRSGSRRLNGEPGDDLLFGPGKIHPLEDGLRWLADHPAEAAALLTARQARWRSLTAPAGEGTHPEPAGSLTPSAYRPLDRPAHQPSLRRGIAAGSDHALVVADLPPHNHTNPRKGQQQPRASVRHYLLQMWVLRRNLLGSDGRSIHGSPYPE
jgi:hypothetical protein